ncbi:hypothetical protein ACT4US_33350, partial [Bacillus sp. HC-Mk]
MSKEELVKKQFGSNADKYVNSKIHAKGLDLQYVVQQVESRHNNRLLDVATGGGHVANMLAQGYILSQSITKANDLWQALLASAVSFVILLVVEMYPCANNFIIKRVVTAVFPFLISF